MCPRRRFFGRTGVQRCKDVLMRRLPQASRLGKVLGTVAALACCLGGALLFSQADLRIPSEVRYKSGYINTVPKPPEFASAMLWGIAIADSRVPNYKEATIEIARTQLVCRADGHNFVLNDDDGTVRGGLYRRLPWFGTDVHDPIPLDYSGDHEIVILHVGNRPDRVWHFWAASPRRALPPGHLEGCTVKIRAKVSNGALLQIGFDYWRDPTVAYGSGGNNHEAGAGDWYFPAPEWQEATFSDIKR
jgi:hypothetical protein